MPNLKTLILRPHPPSGRVAGIAGKDVEVDGDQRVAESMPSAAGAEPPPNSTFVGAESNGEESDARMAKIEEILDHAAMHLLEKCALVAEWVHIAETKGSVFGQIVQKPKGGRPEGGIAQAARALPVPGKTTEARRKFIERAIKIDGIWPEVKVAARTAGLDDTQSALLAIADENLRDKQLAKVKELAAGKALPRRKGKAVDNKHDTTVTNPDGALDDVTAPEILSSEQEAQLAGLKDSWTDAGILKREQWEKSDSVVQRRFVRDSLLIEKITS